MKLVMVAIATALIAVVTLALLRLPPGVEPVQPEIKDEDLGT